MPPVCNSALTNLGSGDCKLNMSEVRRILFTSKLKEDGTQNYISLSNAATLANWQTLFDKYNFSTSILEKVVPTCWIYKFVTEQTDPQSYNEDGAYVKLRDGDMNCSFELNMEVPEYVGALKALENNTLSVYLIDADSRVWGRKDGVNLYPVEIQALQVPNFQIKSAAAPSIEVVRFGFKSPTDLNALTGVEITDGDVASDSDFYSLIDCDVTISSPAATGCVAVIDTSRYDEAVHGITYGAFSFVDIATSVAKGLASGSSLVESPNGTYTINEAALLTAGHSYYLKISWSRYDIEVGTVTVP